MHSGTDVRGLPSAGGTSNDEQRHTLGGRRQRDDNEQRRTLGGRRRQAGSIGFAWGSIGGSIVEGDSDGDTTTDDDGW